MLFSSDARMVSSAQDLSGNPGISQTVRPAKASGADRRRSMTRNGQDFALYENQLVKIAAHAISRRWALSKDVRPTLSLILRPRSKRSMTMHRSATLPSECAHPTLIAFGRPVPLLGGNSPHAFQTVRIEQENRE